jgi:hypothetical protein
LTASPDRAASDEIDERYYAFTLNGSTVDFRRFLNEKAARGWRVVSAGVTDDGWFAVMERADVAG